MHLFFILHIFDDKQIWPEQIEIEFNITAFQSCP